MPADQDTADVPGRNAGRSGHGTNFTLGKEGKPKYISTI